AGQICPLGATIRSELGVNVRADLKDVTEPLFAYGFENFFETGVVAPLVTDLQDSVLLTRELHHLAHFLEADRWRFLDVNVPTRGQDAQRIRAMVRHGRFDDDDLCCG